MAGNLAKITPARYKVTVSAAIVNGQSITYRQVAKEGGRELSYAKLYAGTGATVRILDTADVVSAIAGGYKAEDGIVLSAASGLSDVFNPHQPAAFNKGIAVIFESGVANGGEVSLLIN